MRTSESPETAATFLFSARRLGSEGRGEAGSSLLAAKFNAKAQRRRPRETYLSPDDVLWWSKLVKKTDYFVGEQRWSIHSVARQALYGHPHQASEGVMAMLKPNKELLDAMRAAEQAVAENARADQSYGIRAGDSPLAPWPLEPCSIVFLDFDGVLNSDRSAQQLGTRYRFCHDNVEALNSILQKTDARIVITSSWREHWTLKENAQSLERDGVLPGRVIGKTPTLEGKERGLEIDAWLASVPFAVKAFVILDDRNDMAMHRDKLVLVDSAIGITTNQASCAIEILAKPWTGRPNAKNK